MRCRIQDAGYRMQDARCRIQDAGCKMQDVGCGMQSRCAGFRLGLRCSVSGLRRRSGPRYQDPAPGTWYRTLKGRPGYRRDSRFMFQKTRIRGLHPTSCILYPASCIPHVRVFRRQVAGARFQVPGTWRLGPGTRYRINAEGRIPSTEDRAGRPGPGKCAHRVCVLHPFLF